MSLLSEKMFDIMKTAGLSQADLALINNVQEGTFPVNIETIHSLQKILEKALYLSDTSTSFDGVKKVLQCLLITCQQEGRCNWDELHLQFVTVLRLCLNYVSVVTDNNCVLELLSILQHIITILSNKSEDMKNTMIKILSTPVIDLILKDNIHLLLRRNIIKMFNSVLSGSSLSLRSKITGVLRKSLLRLSELLLYCGDYEFQSAILEFIFRYITIKNNREQYKECFSKYPEIQKAFVSIPFQDFDSDCRIFLNVVNSALSSEQNVFTFPSVKAFVDNREILKPKDENYKELWVDFNMNSHSIIIVCDGSSFIDACVNDWEIITIGCNFVKRAFFKQRNASEVAYSLIIEVGAQKSDAYMTMFPPTANKFEIVFQDTTAINCLIQKVLPTLFGDIFEITNSVEIIQQPISNLNVSRESVVSSAGRGRKVSQAGIYPIKKSSYLSKYQPLNIMMSPRYPLPHRNTERKYLRTDILTISRDLTTRLEDCSQPQSVLSPDPNKGVKNNVCSPTSKLSSPEVNLFGEKNSSDRPSNIQVGHTDKSNNLTMSVTVSDSSENVQGDEIRRKETARVQNIRGMKYWFSGLETTVRGCDKSNDKLYDGGTPIHAKLHSERGILICTELQAGSIGSLNTREVALESIYDPQKENLNGMKTMNGELNDENRKFGTSRQEHVTKNKVSKDLEKRASGMDQSELSHKILFDEENRRDSTDISIEEPSQNIKNINSASKVVHKTSRLENKGFVTTTVTEQSNRKLIPESSESPDLDVQNSQSKQNNNEVKRKSFLASMIIENSKQNTISETSQSSAVAIDKKSDSQIPEKHSKMKRKASMVYMDLQESKQVLEPESYEYVQHNNMQLNTQDSDKPSTMKRKASISSIVVEKSEEHTVRLLNASQEVACDIQLGSKNPEKHRMNKTVSVANILVEKQNQSGILELNESPNDVQFSCQIEEKLSNITEKDSVNFMVAENSKQIVESESHKLSDVHLSPQVMEKPGLKRKSSMANIIMEKSKNMREEDSNKSTETVNSTSIQLESKDIEKYSKIKTKTSVVTAKLEKLKQTGSIKSVKVIKEKHLTPQTSEKNCRVEDMVSLPNSAIEKPKHVKEFNDSTKDLELGCHIADESYKQNDCKSVTQVEKNTNQITVECSKVVDSGEDIRLKEDLKHDRSKRGKYTEVTVKHSKLNRMVFGVKKIVQKPKSSIISSSVSLSKKIKPSKISIRKMKKFDNEKTENASNMEVILQNGSKRNQIIDNVICVDSNNKHSGQEVNQQIVGENSPFTLALPNNQKNMCVEKKEDSSKATLETLSRKLDSQETVKLSNSQEQNEMDHNREITYQIGSRKGKRGEQIQSKIDSQLEVPKFQSAPVESENCKFKENTSEEIRTHQKPESFNQSSNSPDVICLVNSNENSDDDDFDNCFKESIKNHKRQVTKQKTTALSSNKRYPLRQHGKLSEVKDYLNTEGRKPNEISQIGMVTRQRAVKARGVKKSENCLVSNKGKNANTIKNIEGQSSKSGTVSVNNSTVKHIKESESSKRVATLSGHKPDVSTGNAENNKYGHRNKTKARKKLDVVVENTSTKDNKTQQISFKSHKEYSKEELLEIETAQTQIIQPQNIGACVTGPPTVSSDIESGTERLSLLRNASTENNDDTNSHTKHKMTQNNCGNVRDKSISNLIVNYDEAPHTNDVKQDSTKVLEPSTEVTGPIQKGNSSYVSLVEDDNNIQGGNIQLNNYQNELLCDQSNTDMDKAEPDNERLVFKSDIIQIAGSHNNKEKLSSENFLDCESRRNSVEKISKVMAGETEPTHKDKVGLQSLQSPNSTNFDEPNSMFKELKSGKSNTSGIPNSGTSITDNKYSQKGRLNFEKVSTQMVKLVTKVSTDENKTEHDQLTSETVPSLNVGDNLENKNTWQSDQCHHNNKVNCGAEKIKPLQNDRTDKDKDAGINIVTEYFPSPKALKENSLDVTNKIHLEQILQDWDTPPNLETSRECDKSINDTSNRKKNLVSSSFEESGNHKNEYLAAKQANVPLCNKTHPLNLDIDQENKHQNIENVQRSSVEVKNKLHNIVQKSNICVRENIKNSTNHQQSVQGRMTNSISVSKMAELKSLIERKTYKYQNNTESVQTNIQEQPFRAEVRTESLCTTQTPTSRSIENRESSKQSSRKRKLYSESNSPAFINVADYDNSSSDPLWTPRQPSGWRKRRLFSTNNCNGNRAVKEKPERKKKGKKKESEIPTFSFECVSLPQIGEFSPKNSSRWKSKYIDDILKRKSGIKEDVKKKVLKCSIYSDFDTDSDSNVSWLKAFQKPSRFQKPKITYGKSKGTFPSRKLKKQTFPNNKIDKRNVNQDKKDVYPLQQEVLRNEENFDSIETYQEVDILNRNGSVDELGNESFPSLIVENVKELNYFPRTIKLNLQNDGADEVESDININRKNIKHVPKLKSVNVKKDNMSGGIGHDISTKTNISDENIINFNSRDLISGKVKSSKENGKNMSYFSSSSKSKVGYSHINTPLNENIYAGIETGCDVADQSPPIIDIVSDEDNDPQRHSSHGRNIQCTQLHSGHSQYEPCDKEKGGEIILSSNFPKEIKLKKQDISTTQKINAKDLKKYNVSNVSEKHNPRLSVNTIEKQINPNNEAQAVGNSVYTLKHTKNSLETPYSGDDIRSQAKEVKITGKIKEIHATKSMNKKRDCDLDSLEKSSKTKKKHDNRNRTEEVKTVGKIKEIHATNTTNKKRDCDLDSSEKSSKIKKKHANLQSSGHTNEGTITENMENDLLFSSSKIYYEPCDVTMKHKNQSRVSQHDIPIINSKYSGSKERDIQKAGFAPSSPQLLNLEVHNIDQEIHHTRMSEVLSPRSVVGNYSLTPVLNLNEHYGNESSMKELNNFETVKNKLSTKTKSPRRIEDKETSEKQGEFHSMYDEFDKFIKEFEESLEREEHIHGTSMNDKCLSQEEIIKENQYYQTFNTSTTKGDIVLLPEINFPEFSVSGNEHNTDLNSHYSLNLFSQTSEFQADQNNDSEKHLCSSFVTREDRENLQKHHRISEKINNLTVQALNYDIDDEDYIFQTKGSELSRTKKQHDVNLHSCNAADIPISGQIESNISFSHKSINDLASCSASNKRKAKHMKSSCSKENSQHTDSCIQNVPGSAELVNCCSPTKQHKKNKTIPLTENSHNLLLTEKHLKPLSSLLNTKCSRSTVAASLFNNSSRVNVTELGTKSKRPKEKRMHKKGRDYAGCLEIDTEKIGCLDDSTTFQGQTYPSTYMLRQNEDDTLESCSHILECKELSTNIELNTSTPWVMTNLHKQEKQDFMRMVCKKATQIIEDNFKDNCQEGYEKRKVIVNNFLNGLTQEMQDLEENINNLNEQERRLEKLQKYVRRTFSLHRVYVDKMTESNSHLLDMQTNFKKKWNKTERMVQRQHTKRNDKLKEELGVQVTKEMQEYRAHAFSNFMQKMQSIMPGSN